MKKKVIGALLSTFLVSAAAQAHSNTYIVKPGDSLYGIAREQGVTMDQIKQWNGLESDQIWAGQQLLLASPSTPGPSTMGQAVAANRSSASKAIVVADRLNARDRGDLSGNIIGSFLRGMEVDIVEKGERWSLAQSGPIKGYVSNEYLQFGAPAELASRAGSLSEKRLQNILNPLLGAPYRTGGTSPAGFDCSGFTAYVMGQMGVDLPRVSGDQFHTGVSVDRDELQTGDLLFFDSYGSGKITHVSIYLGNNKIAHAATKGVVIEDATWYFNNYPYYGAKRVL